MLNPDVSGYRLNLKYSRHGIKTITKKTARSVKQIQRTTTYGASDAHNPESDFWQSNICYSELKASTTLTGLT